VSMISDAEKITLTLLAIFVNIVKTAYTCTISPDRMYGNERMSNKVTMYENRQETFFVSFGRKSRNFGPTFADNF
jgi:hypothetical protein